MEKIKVVVTDYIEPDLNWEIKELNKYPQVDFQYYQLKFKNEEEILGKISDAQIIVVNMVPITRDILKNLKRCKLIIRHGIGYDNVDVSACSEFGITLANIPDYCVEEVAEQAVMLLFSCGRKINVQKRILQDSAQRGEWDFSDIYPVYKLREKTLGLVGCGRIGSTVLQMMRGIGMNVRICDPYLSESRLKELNTKHEDLNTIIKESDFISVHCLLNEETKDMFTYEQFKKMKSTAVFVNTARGGIVKTDDLIRAMEEKLIAAAGIDVYAGKEPPSPDSSMFKMDNMILSPHIGWYSEESGISIRTKIIDDIKRYLNSEKPRFIVNK